MLRLSGPEYVSVISVNKAMNIVLLGDDHVSAQRECDKCRNSKNCKDINHFLQTLIKPAHILLEAPYATKFTKKEVKTFVSSLPKLGYLSKALTHFDNHMYAKHTPENLHVHHGDFRFHPSFALLRHTQLALKRGDIKYIPYVQSVIHDFATSRTFKEFIDACIYADDYVQAIEHIFGKRASVYWEKKNLTSHGDKRHIHRLRKQMLKLSPSSQYAVKRFHRYVSKEIIDDYYSVEYKRVRHQLLLQETYDDIEVVVFTTIIQKWLSHIMDLYMITRMLYIIECGQTQTIVCYTGSNHAFTYQLFLEKFMKKNMTELRWECNKVYEQQKQRGCVTIPLEIAKELVK